MSIHHIELDEEMEAPCLCDCGEWFDLDDGMNEIGSNKIICRSCGSKQRKVKDLHDEIYELEKEDNTKRKVKALKKQITELGFDYDPIKFY